MMLKLSRTDTTTNFREVMIVLRDLLKSQKGEWIVEVKKVRKQRTLPQNNYYWHIITTIVKETGEDKNRIHEEMAYEYACDHANRRARSTKDMDVFDFTEYVERVRMRALDLGIHIMTPEEYYAS